MFDMMKLGKNISARRKALGMTQMELADKLNISYQAVSNWERGQTCPDISKLGELSEILGCTTDELLGSQRTAEVIKQIEEEKPDPDVTPEELADVAPILKPKQVDRTFGSLMEKLGGLGETISKKINDAFDSRAMGEEISRKVRDAVNSATSALDGVNPEDVHVERLNTDGKRFGASITITTKKDREELEQSLRTLGLDSGSIDRLMELARRFGTDSVSDKLGKYGDEIAEHIDDIEEELEDKRPDIHEGRQSRGLDLETLARLAPYLPTETLNEKLRELGSREDADIGALCAIAPHADDDVVAEVAREMFRRSGNLNDLAGIAPFMDDEVVGEIAKIAIERGGVLSDLAPIAPFMDDDDIGELAKTAIQRGGELGDLAGIAPFMDDEVVGEIAKMAIERGGELSDLAPIAPFMDDEIVSELAKTAIQRGGELGDLAGIAPFMDEDDIGELAKTAIGRGGDIGALCAIAPFMDEEQLAEIAMNALENGADFSELQPIMPFLGDFNMKLWKHAAAAKPATPPTPPVPPTPPKQDKEELKRAIITLLNAGGESAITSLRGTVDPIVLGEALREWERDKNK